MGMKVLCGSNGAGSLPEAEEKARKEAEAKAKAEAEERARKEAEEKARKEARLLPRSPGLECAPLLCGGQGCQKAAGAPPCGTVG